MDDPPRPIICARCREPVGRVVYEYPVHMGDEHDGSAVTGLYVFCAICGSALEMDNGFIYPWLMAGMEPAWKIIRPEGSAHAGEALPT